MALVKPEVGILGMSARVRVRKRREEQRAGVGTHVQAVRHGRDRSKEETADYFGAHHRTTEPDHGPRFALTLIVPRAEEDVLMEWWFRKRGIDCHASLTSDRFGRRPAIAPLHQC